jgi:DNA (cytosine-5)-methyltransferase 1
MMYAKTFAEFFAGIGLVREALESREWRCVYANDIDLKKWEMYRGQFGPSPEFDLGDVWDTSRVVSRIDEWPFMATASFPCTDMSLAGNMRGFSGAHSSAFFGFVKVLEALGDHVPKLVVLENVTGFLYSRGGHDFSAATRTLANLGYWLDAFILDARVFVPQSRPRLFLLGYHDSLASSERLVKKGQTESLLDDNWLGALRNAQRLRPPRLRRTIENIELPTGWVTQDTSYPKSRKHCLRDVIDLSSTLDWWSESEVMRHYRMMSDRHRRQVDALLRSGGIIVATAYRRIRHGQQRAEVRLDGLAGCLRTPRGGSAKQIVIAIQHGVLRMRWMSPREYARLQGADNYQLPSNTIQGLYGFGDAVCVPVVQWIDEAMLTPFFRSVCCDYSTSDARPVFAG